MDAQTDLELLRSAQRGDRAAYEALFTRHYERVYRASYALVRSPDLADDAAQEAFLALYARAPRLDRDGALIGWLCRVALNCSLNMLRGDRRAQARAARMADVGQPEPIDGVLREEEHAMVRAALAQLPERQAQILALRQAGLSYAAIAAALEVAPGSVGTLLARAERALAAAYAALDREPPLLATDRR